MKTIRMLDLKTAFDQKTANELILDVRTPEEFSEGHVPGARNIPHDEILGHAEELKPFETVYVYCRSGNRVGMAAMDLSRAGVENLVCIVGGGMPDWIAAGLPVEK